MENSEEPASVIQQLEMKLLLEAVFHCTGQDFRDYSASSVMRRVQAAVHAEGEQSISALQARVLHDSEAMQRLLAKLTIHVTSMFRDPSFYYTLRQKVVPLLRTYPFARIWHAGCSTGEEVYSLAILLKEEGVYERCRIYATDLSEAALEGAKQGAFPVRVMQEYTTNYQLAGGVTSFSDYYTVKQDRAVFRPSLREHVVFAQHNLVTDGSFNEFNLILCRNVAIYFNRKLRERVFGLLYDSLAHLGILGVGHKESLHFTPHESCYEPLDLAARLFRKLR